MKSFKSLRKANPSKYGLHLWPLNCVGGFEVSNTYVGKNFKNKTKEIDFKRKLRFFAKSIFYKHLLKLAFIIEKYIILVCLKLHF